MIVFALNRAPISMSEAVEKRRLRNINRAEAACDERDYVQHFDRGNPADTLIEHAVRDVARDTARAANDVNVDSSTDTCDSSTDTCDEDEQMAPLRDAVAANSVTRHTNQHPLRVTEIGSAKMAFDQNCEFDGFKDAEER